MILLGQRASASHKYEQQRLEITELLAFEMMPGQFSFSRDAFHYYRRHAFTLKPGIAVRDIRAERQCSCLPRRRARRRQLSIF